jgi:hypothetical protein
VADEQHFTSILSGSFQWFLPFLTYGGGMLLAGMVSLLATSKFKKPRVFISYPREHFDTAKQIASALAKLGIIPLYEAPASQAHDALLANLRSKLRGCDVLILVAPFRDSFADAEVLAASVMAKPIIILSIE